MDETMCQFDMPEKQTNNIKGKKTVRISTTGGAKKVLPLLHVLLMVQSID
jgi:hypothetical protein